MCNKFYNWILLLCLVFVFSCTQNNQFERGKLTGEFESIYRKLVKEKYNLEVAGSGGGYYDGKIQHFGSDFRTYEPFELESARILMRGMIYDMKELAKQHRDFLIYMSDQEFKNERIFMTLYFYDHQDRTASVFFVRGKIEYETVDPISNKLTLVAWEMYDEGVLHLVDQPEPHQNSSQQTQKL